MFFILNTTFFTFFTNVLFIKHKSFELIFRYRVFFRKRMLNVQKEIGVKFSFYLKKTSWTKLTDKKYCTYRYAFTYNFHFFKRCRHWKSVFRNNFLTILDIRRHLLWKSRDLADIKVQVDLRSCLTVIYHSWIIHEGVKRSFLRSIDDAGVRVPHVAS